jgi:hypothetical protein
MAERLSLSQDELTEKRPYSIHADPKPAFPELPVLPDNKDIIHFSKEHRKILEKNSYQIFRLQGASIHDLCQLGFIKNLPLSPEIEAITALPSEIAFNLKTGFKNIDTSENLGRLTLPSRSFFVPDKKIKSGYRQISGLSTAVANLATYSELAFHYYQKTGLPLWTGDKKSRTGYLMTGSGPDVSHLYCFGGQPSRDIRPSIYSFDKSVNNIVNRLLLVVPNEVFRTLSTV